MGTVYAARHRNMQRTIALKLLKASLVADDDKITRFRNEARVLSSLQHPNIVAVHAIGMADTGQPYMAMDIVTGQSLSEAIAASGFLKQDEALRICIAICDGLEYAHSHNIIHRDIKPSNIILSTTDGGIKVPKLVDFGIAKMLGPDGSQHLTQTGVAVGSVFYLSPGQFEGRAADPTSDIYALGCTLYEMLTGVPPFESDNFFETALQHQQAHAIPVNERNPNAHVSAHVQCIIDHMLEKVHHLRYQSAEHLREDLSRVLEKQPPIHAANASNRARITSTTSPSKPPTQLRAIALAAIASTCITVLGFFFLSVRREDIATQAPPPRNLAQEANALAQRTLNQIRIDHSDGQNELPIFRRAVEIADKNRDPLLRAEAYRLLAEAYRDMLLAHGIRDHKNHEQDLILLQHSIELSSLAGDSDNQDLAKYRAVNLERFRDTYEYVWTIRATNDFPSRKQWSKLLHNYERVKSRQDLPAPYRDNLRKLVHSALEAALYDAVKTSDLTCLNRMIDISAELDVQMPPSRTEILAFCEELEKKLRDNHLPKAVKRVRTAYGIE